MVGARGEAHVDNHRLVGLGQSRPIEIGRGPAGGVAGDEGHRLGRAATGQGRAGRRRGGQGGGDSRNDPAVDTGGAAGFQFLAATARR